MAAAKAKVERLRTPTLAVREDAASVPSSARPSTSTRPSSERSSASRPTTLAPRTASSPTLLAPRTTSSPTTPAPRTASSPITPAGGRPKARARPAEEATLEGSPGSGWEEVPEESVTSVLAQQQNVLALQLNNMEERFQAMFAQVLSHVTQMQQAPVEEVPVVSDDDFEMTKPGQVQDPRLEMPGCMESQARR